jgi:hypothetical protein
MRKCVVHGAAHCDEAAAARGLFVWMQRASNDRADAVCADQQIALGRGAIRQPQRDAIARRGEANHRSAKVERRRVDGVEQGSMQRRPQRHQHRPAEGARRHLHALQHRAVHAPELPAPRLETATQHRVGDAQLAQGGDGIRRQRHAEAELTRRGGLLEDANVPAGAAQGDRRG